ncbi:pectinesterase-like [Nymphaea colorata]|nr:pectinesterase-like [Nymphaea colorata]
MSVSTTTHFSASIVFVLFVFVLLPFSSSQNLTQSVTPEKACNLTTNPSFCKSLIPSRARSNLYGYGRYLVNKSLRQSATFSSLIDGTIRGNASLPSQAAGALVDCLLLSQLTTDFLVSSLATLESNDTTKLPDAQGDKVQTLLSAIVTNQQTCLDGLTQANFLKRKNALYAPLVNGTKLYSVSLAMFTHSWVPKKKKTKTAGDAASKTRPGRELLDRLDYEDGLPYWVNRDIFRMNRRMALEEDSVLVSDVVYVAQDGTGNFTAIGDAVAAAPNISDPNGGYFVIYVAAGVYREYVSIDKRKKNIMMVGDGINQTIITGNRSVGDGWTTFNSATLAVVGQGFVGIGFTVQNTAGPAKGQAVAVRNGADTSTFYQCSFEGYQDTLYTHSMRQFYRECDVYGTVDFIFGNAAVVFQDSNLYARLPLPGQANMFTAQGRTDPNQNTGTSIINCSVLAAPDLAADGKTQSYLGRPWKEYSRTVYMHSFIDGLIDPTGWSPWSGDFALSTLYYGEYGNRGPGSDTSKRVQWLGYHAMALNETSNFTVVNFVQGDVWLPATSVTFSAGLD